MRDPSLLARLEAYASSGALPMHMPGHKRNLTAAPFLAPLGGGLDITEIDGFDNLHDAQDVLRREMERAAALWGARRSFFLVNGSTCGLLAAVYAVAAGGGSAIVARNCHKAVYHALELCGLTPRYLLPDWCAEWGIYGSVSPESVAAALVDTPNARFVLLTSPTFEGALSDISAIAKLCHQAGVPLLVDEAHGAHLGLGGFPAEALACGADVVIQSAHKTLPAMGQAALLFTNGIDPGQVRRTAAIYGTSSPSYPILASLDTAREWLEGPGAGEYGRVARRTAALRCRFPSLCPPLPLDPTRFTLKVKNGPAFTGQLESRCNIWPEMEDGGHVVFILTACDGEEVLDRLESVLEGMEEQMGDSAPLPPPPLPERVLSPRQAQFAPAEVLPLERTEGRVCTCQLAPYPPGVPVVAPGERIGKKELAYFRQIGYNNREVTVAAMP